VNKGSVAEIASDCRHAADRLHAYLVGHHVGSDGAVTGPDVGVRLNLRVGRLVKSYLRFLPWTDTFYYTQGQTYWILDNLELHRLTGDAVYLQNAVRCCDTMLARQTPEGYWEFPHNEWKGVIATVETCFGGLGLLAVYEATRDERFLSAAKRTYDYIINEVGFQKYDEDSLAVNYFSNRAQALVPNNSTLAVWFCAALNHATGDPQYLAEYCAKMINFLVRCQFDSGELPYMVAGELCEGRDHYQCFQYNSFQFMDIVQYHRITGDDGVLPMMGKLAEFLSHGLTREDNIRADCSSDRPVRHYCTAAISAALTRATQEGLGDYTGIAARGFAKLLSWQRKDGGFGFSVRDYRFLSDRRSYPRVMCMILRHLLIGSELGAGEPGEVADA
jgi:hypothetical protein